MDKKEMYSQKLIRGKRTYFFDLKKSEQGDVYLTISESKKTENGFEHYQVMIFDEDIDDFEKVLNQVLSKRKALKTANETDSKKYSVAKIREVHQQAYQPWTAEDDHKLEILFCEGKKTKELAKIFGRNVGAITSRIKKLELRVKYSK